MTDVDEPDRLRTVGDLRRRLAEAGDPWAVRADVADDDPLDGLASGPTPAVVWEGGADPIAPDADLGEIIASVLPTNPLLQERWVDAGLVEPDQVVTGTPVIDGSGS
jgi:hypothetical protein